LRRAFLHFAQAETALQASSIPENEVRINALKQIIKRTKECLIRFAPL